MKFIVKWNNGYWKVFDTVKYEDYSLYYLKKDAEYVCDKLNTSKK